MAVWQWQHEKEGVATYRSEPDPRVSDMARAGLNGGSTGTHGRKCLKNKNDLRLTERNVSVFASEG